jgi:hypothetical protein
LWTSAFADYDVNEEVIVGATPSRIHVPRGVGPVPIPFRECSIVLEHCRERPYLDGVVEGSIAAEKWHRSWGPEMRDNWMDPTSSVLPALPKFAPRRGSGHREWFVTLVALCEPHLGRGAAVNPRARRGGERQLHSQALVVSSSSPEGSTGRRGTCCRWPSYHACSTSGRCRMW